MFDEVNEKLYAWEIWENFLTMRRMEIKYYGNGIFSLGGSAGDVLGYYNSEGKIEFILEFNPWSKMLESSEDGVLLRGGKLVLYKDGVVEKDLAYEGTYYRENDSWEMTPITWFDYSNEEEYEKVLLYLNEVIIKYGFEFLNQMSIEEIIPTKSMANRLYKSHSELDNSFLSKYKIASSPQNLSDIEDWFQKLKQLIIFATEKPYEDVKELFVEMAAFIGERNCELLGAKWFFVEEMQTPFTQGENNQGMCFFPLNEVVGYYREYKRNRKNLSWFENEITELKQAFQVNND